MNQKGLAPILIIILVAAALLGGYFIYQNQPKPTNSPQPSPLSTEAPAKVKDPTANWKTYNSIKNGFSIQYPSDEIIVKEYSDGSFKLESTSYSSNSNDFLSLIFYSGSLENKTLKDFVRDTIADGVKNQGEVVLPQTSITIGSIQGHKYSMKGVAFVGGDVEYSYISSSPGRYIGIEDYLWSTSSEKANNIKNQILSTFKFTQ